MPLSEPSPTPWKGRGSGLVLVVLEVAGWRWMGGGPMLHGELSLGVLVLVAMVVP